MNHSRVKITSSLKLSNLHMRELAKILEVKDMSQIVWVENSDLIAGIKVEIDGQMIDLSIKNQLEEIARG